MEKISKGSDLWQQNWGDHWPFESHLQVMLVHPMQKWNCKCSACSICFSLIDSSKRIKIVWLRSRECFYHKELQDHKTIKMNIIQKPYSISSDFNWSRKSWNVWWLNDGKSCIYLWHTRSNFIVCCFCWIKPESEKSFSDTQ